MSADILDQLAMDVGASVAAEPTKPVIQKLRYTHDALINLIISSQGTMNQNHLAAHFGMSASWISQVMSSDIFQDKLMERTAELVDPAIRASVEEKLKGVLNRSIEILKEKLEGPADKIGDQLLLRTLDISARALGYGAREQQVNVQVNVDNHLEQLGGRLVNLLNRKKAESNPQLVENSNAG